MNKPKPSATSRAQSMLCRDYAAHLQTQINESRRISDCLAYIAANPAAHYPKGWIAEVQAEARAAGLLPPLAPSVGCNCRPGIDAGIVYGGDL